ncbi:MAG: methyltransferase domain-containing protein [Rhodobacteraceae bacterium]|nr:methyltransferase domain-containing protein [Paracoccaceae bacterium]
MGSAGHGALMDGVYRHQRFIYDVTRKYYLLGRDRMIEGLAVPAGGSVLEVACGTGRNLIRVARRYPDAQLCGFDISAEMLTTARASVGRAGLSDRIRLAEGDATDFDPAAMFGVPAFDRILISYSLSMIPDWEAALAEAARHLAPGGQLAIVDFGQGAGLPTALTGALRRWLALFHVAPRAELPEALARVAQDIGAGLDIGHPYRDYAVTGRITRPA